MCEGLEGRAPRGLQVTAVACDVNRTLSWQPRNTPSQVLDPLPPKGLQHSCGEPLMCVSAHFLLARSLWHTCFYVHFTDEQTEAQNSSARTQGHTGRKSGLQGGASPQLMVWVWLCCLGVPLSVHRGHLRPHCSRMCAVIVHPALGEWMPSRRGQSLLSSRWCLGFCLTAPPSCPPQTGVIWKALTHEMFSQDLGGEDGQCWSVY